MAHTGTGGNGSRAEGSRRDPAPGVAQMTQRPAKLGKSSRLCFRGKKSETKVHAATATEVSHMGAPHITVATFVPVRPSCSPSLSRWQSPFFRERNSPLSWLAGPVSPASPAQRVSRHHSPPPHCMWGSAHLVSPLEGPQLLPVCLASPVPVSLLCSVTCSTP